MIYFIADTHFGHTNIIKYCNRPFEDSHEMGQHIIGNWNATVKDEDIVYHLGDFCFKYDRPRTTELVQQLNGHKILIMGNHDNRHTVTKWKEMGFEEAYKEPLVLNDTFVLSHWPVIDPDLFNIHGHIHNYQREEFFKQTAMCVSVEMINYTPISLKEVMERYDRIHGR